MKPSKLLFYFTTSDMNMSISKWLLVSFSLFLFRIRSISDIACSAGVDDASTAKYLAPNFEFQLFPPVSSSSEESDPRSHIRISVWFDRSSNQIRIRWSSEYLPAPHYGFVSVEALVEETVDLWQLVRPHYTVVHSMRPAHPSPICIGNSEDWKLQAV